MGALTQLLATNLLRVLEVPKTEVIPRSGYDYPNEWSTELFEKVGSCDC